MTFQLYNGHISFKLRCILQIPWTKDGTGEKLISQAPQKLQTAAKKKLLENRVYREVIEGSLEVKLPTIWTDEKQSRAEAERRDRLEERRSEKRKSQKKEDADARKGRKVAKAAGAEPAGQTRDEKLHAVVARSTFPSQNVQNTPWSEHFWKLRCQKSARRCGAKHISKSKCTKHQGFGPLLEVEMSKKCTPLWREAHFQVKMHKTHHSRTTFGSWDVEKVHAVVARSTFPSQKCQKLTVSDHFWRFRCRKPVEKVHAVVARSTFRS